MDESPDVRGQDLDLQARPAPAPRGRSLMPQSPLNSADIKLLPLTVCLSWGTVCPHFPAPEEGVAQTTDVRRFVRRRSLHPLRTPSICAAPATHSAMTRCLCFAIGHPAAPSEAPPKGPQGPA